MAGQHPRTGELHRAAHDHRLRHRHHPGTAGLLRRARRRDASRPSAPGSAFPLDLDRQLAETERDLILRALEETGGVQVKAAELLNISERSMWHRIKKLGINIINKKEMI
ncbi:MAG: helix-turn-helix domain-containing protein [Bilophila wadsworthia]